MATPVDRASIVAAFRALPSEVAGLPRIREEPLEVSFGPSGEVFIRALRADDPDYPSAVRWLDGLVHSGEVQIEETVLDPESALVYVVATGTEDSAPSYLAVWGAPDFVWVFAVNADTPHLRAALAEEFAETVTRISTHCRGEGEECGRCTYPEMRTARLRELGRHAGSNAC